MRKEFNPHRNAFKHQHVYCLIFLWTNMEDMPSFDYKNLYCLLVS